MVMHTVDSTNICSVGWENGVLHIRFNSGTLYAYNNVPESVYLGLMSASSHGRYFNANIKNVYPYRRIG